MCFSAAFTLHQRVGSPPPCRCIYRAGWGLVSDCVEFVLLRRCSSFPLRREEVSAGISNQRIPKPALPLNVHWRLQL